MKTLIGALGVLWATAAWAAECPVPATQTGLDFDVGTDKQSIRLRDPRGKDPAKVICVLALVECTLKDNASRISWTAGPNRARPGDPPRMLDIQTVYVTYTDGTSAACKLQTAFEPLEFKFNLPPIAPLRLPPVEPQKTP